MWIFQFNASGKIIWANTQSATVLGFKSVNQLIGLAADMFVHIPRFSRWTEEMMVFGPTSDGIDNLPQKIGEYLIEGVIAEKDYRFQAGAKEIICESIADILRHEADGSPIINWPGNSTSRDGSTYPARFSLWISHLNPDPVFTCLCLPFNLGMQTESFVNALISLNSLIDKDLASHESQVTRLANRIGESVGFSAARLDLLKKASFLHDIGKIFISDEIIHKPGPLTQSEEKIVRKHPLFSEQLLRCFPSLQPESRIISTHHEKWDGSGYPYGLKGNVIPLCARIISVADTYRALIEKRPYKSCWSLIDALALLQCEAGISYDYEMVNRLTALVHPQTLRRYTPGAAMPSVAAVAQ